ncbi:MAG: protein phosphatase 2C domain-containing protein [Alcaligenaceae bacterium]|nr:MAG: protein phosphatase 2C domain-containing protein [Alcaligenaceae bacterium]
MSFWRSFGATVRGPGHVLSGEANQDAWASFHRSWGDGIAVSDGLGSKPLSNFGSEAACVAVAHAARTCRSGASVGAEALASRIRSHWLSLIEPLSPDDCAATCLFALRLGDGAIHLGMLGDGLVAALKRDGSIARLEEDKSQGFSNTTAALTPHVSAKHWQYLVVPEYECAAIVLCSDGVADDLDDVNGFIENFMAAHHELAAVSASRRIREMLEKWPTPKHSDDKSIACLCRGGGDE